MDDLIIRSSDLTKSDYHLYCKNKKKTKQKKLLTLQAFILLAKCIKNHKHRNFPYKWNKIWIKCFDHLNWLLSTWWIDCSTLNSSHTPSTASLLMSPETQWRKRFLLHPSGIIFFLSPAGTREHGRRLECKWSGKLRALPSGCAASSPRPSTTNKTPGTEHGCEVCHR